MPGDSDRRSGFKTTSSRRSAPVRSIRRPCAEEPLQDSVRDSRTWENPLSVESGALNRSEASPAPTPVPLLQRSCAQRVHLLFDAAPPPPYLVHSAKRLLLPLH